MLDLSEFFLFHGSLNAEPGENRLEKTWNRLRANVLPRLPQLTTRHGSTNMSEPERFANYRLRLMWCLSRLVTAIICAVCILIVVHIWQQRIIVTNLPPGILSLILVVDAQVLLGDTTKELIIFNSMTAFVFVFLLSDVLVDVSPVRHIDMHFGWRVLLSKVLLPGLLCRTLLSMDIEDAPITDIIALIVGNVVGQCVSTFSVMICDGLLPMGSGVCSSYCRPLTTKDLELDQKEHVLSQWRKTSSVSEKLARFDRNIRNTVGKAEGELTRLSSLPRGLSNYWKKVEQKSTQRHTDTLPNRFVEIGFILVLTSIIYSTHAKVPGGKGHDAIPSQDSFHSGICPDSVFNTMLGIYDVGHSGFTRPVLDRRLLTGSWSAGCRGAQYDYHIVVYTNVTGCKLEVEESQPKLLRPQVCPLSRTELTSSFPEFVSREGQQHVGEVDAVSAVRKRPGHRNIIGWEHKPKGCNEITDKAQFQRIYLDDKHLLRTGQKAGNVSKLQLCRIRPPSAKWTQQALHEDAFYFLWFTLIVVELVHARRMRPEAMQDFRRYVAEAEHDIEFSRVGNLWRLVDRFAGAVSRSQQSALKTGLHNLVVCALFVLPMGGFFIYDNFHVEMEDDRLGAYHSGATDDVNENLDAVGRIWLSWLTFDIDLQGTKNPECAPFIFDFVSSKIVWMWAKITFEDNTDALMKFDESLKIHCADDFAKISAAWTYILVSTLCIMALVRVQVEAQQRHKTNASRSRFLEASIRCVVCRPDELTTKRAARNIDAEPLRAGTMDRWSRPLNPSSVLLLQSAPCHLL